MMIKTFILSIIFSMVSVQIHAQNIRARAADKDYEKLAYVDAIKIYERVAEKGYKDEEMLKKLANAYYFNADFLKANTWYEELFKLSDNLGSEYYFRYSQTLKSVGNYNKAEKILNKYEANSGNILPLKINELDYLKQIALNSGRYVINNAEINSKFSDYGVSFLNDKLVFTSARRISGPSKHVFSWTNKFFSNLFQSDVKPNGTLSDPKPFKGTINSKFNESTPVFTKDGLTMYFTRNNYLNRKRGSNEKEVTLLKLYKAVFIDGKWGGITELPFNSDQYSCAHPALSTDEKTLYFVSNMPGTIGGSDLFKVEIHNGNYGEPKNLGKTINTYGRETFPFVSENNELYFSSNGHLGLGGLDVFVTPLSTLNNVQNVGEPVNGKQDDFAFYINTTSSKGFFSSNREGGQGEDDIYKFIETQKLNGNSLVSGFVVNKENIDQKISEVHIDVFDDRYKLVDTFMSDKKGFYKIRLYSNKVSYIRFKKPGYQTKEVVISTNGVKPIRMQMFLEKRNKPIEVGTDLSSIVNISKVYFDKDKWRIKKNAEFQLQKIVEILKVYPKMSIEIRSHTDSRQSKAYNLTLSRKRARATRVWLIKKGIASERLKQKGYGENQILNQCSDGVKCSEEEHQVNRRSEFVITNIK